MFSKSDWRVKVQDLEIGLTLDRQTSPYDILETAIHTAEKMASKDGKRMVILLDEFQELDRLGGETLLKRLRSIFQQQEHTTYFFLGSESSLLQTIFADRRQEFYRFATLLQLPPPYCVMAIMANAYLVAKMHRLDEINAEILHSSYQQSMLQLDAIYEEQWQEIRRFKGADELLTAILLGRPLHQKESTANTMRAIQNLIRLSVIKKGMLRGQYELLEPMFGEWILQKRQGKGGDFSGVLYW